VPAPAFAIKTDRDQLVIDKLVAAFGDAIVSHERVSDMMVITVKKPTIHDVLKFLRDEVDFNFLTSMCGMHYAERDALGLVFHMHSMRNGHRIRLKTETPMKDPAFPTFTDLWPASNWMEREAWDFFGISFTGHPNLKRILNMEDFPAFPMRKDYPLEDPTREDKDDSYFGR
jgi:NADH-quinone oxidoreductase subunit C